MKMKDPRGNAGRGIGVTDSGDSTRIAPTFPLSACADEAFA